MSFSLFSRSIGPISIDAVLNESHKTELEITKNPVEFGADVTDHAYAQPKVVTMTVGKGKSLADASRAFNQLVAFQESRIPFVMVTPIYVYRNMLIKSIDATRDKDTSNILYCTVELNEIILVNSAAYSGRSTQPQSAGAGSSREGAAAAKTSQSGLANSTVSGPQVARGEIAARTVPTDTVTPEGQRNRSVLRGMFG